MAFETGIVKWFNDAKGFGFIKQNNGLDVFVHYSVIMARGYRKLKEGEIVSYKRGESAKGPYAKVLYKQESLEGQIPSKQQIFSAYQKFLSEEFSGDLISY